MSQKDERETMNEGHGALPQVPGTCSDAAPPELGREIAKQLRALYGRQVAEPLPDKFTNLLDQLARAERKE